MANKTPYMSIHARDWSVLGSVLHTYAKYGQAVMIPARPSLTEHLTILMESRDTRGQLHWVVAPLHTAGDAWDSYNNQRGATK